MTIPTSVRVGPLTYRVLTDVDKIREASASADIEDNVWTAFADHDALVIGINDGNPADCQRRDLLHELLHCCLRLSGVEPNQYANLVYRAEGRHGGYTVEEYSSVAATAAPLLGILRDNPNLTLWLCQDDDRPDVSKFFARGGVT